MKETLLHIEHCSSGMQCSTNHHCVGSRRIIHHWKNCLDVNCVLCCSYRKPIVTYLQEVFGNPRWKAEVLSKYSFCIRVLMPNFLRVHAAVSTPQDAHLLEKSED